jgi:hypothetical protein
MLRHRINTSQENAMIGTDTQVSQTLEHRLATAQNDPALPGLASVLLRPSVIQDVHACLRRIFSSDDCSKQCEDIADNAGAVLAGVVGVSCGLLGFGTKFIVGLAAPVPGGAIAGGALAGAGCIVDGILAFPSNQKWSRWEAECKDCCAKNCSPAVCTSNRPRVSTEPPRCQPPTPR